MGCSSLLISQCYNSRLEVGAEENVVAPFLISQCYNSYNNFIYDKFVVALLISQCYNLPPPTTA